MENDHQPHQHTADEPKSPTSFRERLSFIGGRKRGSGDKDKGEQQIEKPDSGPEVKLPDIHDWVDNSEPPPSQEQLSLPTSNGKSQSVSPSMRGKDGGKNLAKEGMEKIDKTMVDIKRLISTRTKKIDKVSSSPAVPSAQSYNSGSEPQDTTNASLQRERLKGKKYILWVQIFRAKETPMWPSNSYPRSYVAVAVDRVRTVTGRWGGHESSYDHTSPNWNEALTLPLDPNGTDGCVRIKLHTVINMAMDTRHDVAVAKAAFPIGNIPICEEIPSDEVIAQLANAEAQVVSAFPDDEGDTADFTPGRLNITDGQPVKVWIKMKKTERARFPILTGMASMYGKGRGWLLLSMCLVPAENAALGDSFYTEDEGDSEGATPITFPEPLEKIYFDDIQPCSVHKLDRLLFGANSKFTVQLYKERNYTNLTVGDWDTTQKPISRTIRYMLPANSFSDGSMATETQTMVVDEEGGKVVQMVVHTPDVPYGGCFHNELQYCTTRIDDNSCRLRISHTTVFTKKTMLRSAIDAGAEKGIRASATQVVSLLDGFLRRGISKRTVIQACEERRNYIKELYQHTAIWTDWLRDGTVPAPAFVAVCFLLLVSLLLNFISFSPSPMDDLSQYVANVNNNSNSNTEL